MNSKPLDADDKIVTSELERFWLRPGERLLLGCPPIRGYAGARIGEQVRVPHEPIGDVPELDLGRMRWPLPADATAASPDVDGDWVDDPTLGYWATAPHPETAAVRLADHFAHSRGEARLVLSDHRVAVVYPTKLFHPGDPNPPSVFTTHAEMPARQLIELDAPFAGHSLTAPRAILSRFAPRGIRPPFAPRVIRLRFADGSALQLRDSHAAARVQRAHQYSMR